MTLIEFDILLLEPLLATSLDGDPNSAVSFPFIPGSLIRGALIARYIAQSKNQQIDASDPAVRAIFFDSTTCFLNGYPLVDGKERARPLPLSLRSDKTVSASPLYDFAVESADLGKAQRTGVGTFGMLKAQAVEVDVQRNIVVHTLRDRHFGRSRTETGAIYRYDSLAAGQVFRAQILCPQSHAKQLKQLLGTEMHLGGARSAGYGHVQIKHVVTPQTISTWLANRFSTAGIQKNAQDCVVITLLSDWMLRDELGNYTTDPVDVAKALGLELVDAFAEIRPIGGFNRKWGLPLDHKTVFCMGSVFVCKAPAQFNTLQKKVQTGVGEGRTDGFGRFAVNWQTQSVWLKRSKPKTPPKPSPIALPAGTSSHEIASHMTHRMLQKRVDVALITKANQLSSKRVRNVSKSQLYRLRLKLQFYLQQPDATLDVKDGRKQIVAYIESLKSRNSTRRQFSRAKIDGTRLLEWIEAQILQTDSQEMLDELEISTYQAQIGTVAAAWNDTYLFRVALRFVDSVLAGLAKHAREVNE